MNGLLDTLAADVSRIIRDVPDFPKPGILFKDITTVLLDGPLYARLIDHLCDLVSASGATVVAGIESRGYLFAAPVAARLSLPLALIRKPGKLPWKTRKASYSLEYGTDSVEIHEDAVQPGDKVVVMDDLLATGGTMEAACRLVRELGGEVVLASFVIELAFLDGRKRLGSTPGDGMVVDALLVY